MTDLIATTSGAPGSDGDAFIGFLIIIGIVILVCKCCCSSCKH
jgi:hypothetical protein